MELQTEQPKIGKEFESAILAKEGIILTLCDYKHIGRLTACSYSLEGTALKDYHRHWAWARISYSCAKDAHARHC